MPKERKHPLPNVEQIGVDGAGIPARWNEICQGCLEPYSLALFIPLPHYLKDWLLLKLKFLVLLCSRLARQHYFIEFAQQLLDGACKQGTRLV